MTRANLQLSDTVKVMPSLSDAETRLSLEYCAARRANLLGRRRSAADSPMSLNNYSKAVILSLAQTALLSCAARADFPLVCLHLQAQSLLHTVLDFSMAAGRIPAREDNRERIPAREDNPENLTKIMLSNRNTGLSRIMSSKPDKQPKQSSVIRAIAQQSVFNQQHQRMKVCLTVRDNNNNLYYQIKIAVQAEYTGI